MLVTIFSWIVIFIVFTAIGFGLAKLIFSVFKYKIDNIHAVIMLGIVFCTVYAETFSIMYKLGAVAFIVLSVIMVFLMIYSGGEAYDKFCVLKKQIVGNRWRYASLTIAFVGLLFLAAYFTSRPPVGFDAQNYHIPDIRWLEEYGAVKGAGNLSPWLAYNSSFHCLQALFSFAWLNGTSMHSMNGFIWLFTVFYAASTFSVFSGRSFALSDVLRIIYIKVLFGCLVLGLNEPLAAPDTDLMPICLAGYIFIEWCALNESGEKNEIPYGLLGVLGLFSASVKLSVAVLFVMALKPCFALVKEHRFSDLLKFVCLGCIVVVPFLIRSVILSGYLVYPIAAIDLFDFDWEMPKSVVVTDSAFIKLFARAAGGKYTYSDLNDSFIVWFDRWISRNYVHYMIIVIIDIFVAVFEVLKSVYLVFKRKRGTYDSIIGVGAAFGFLIFLFSAPSLRFGVIWLYTLPAICICGFVDIYAGDIMNISTTDYMRRLLNPSVYCALSAVILLVSLVHFYYLYRSYGFDAKIIPKDYDYTMDENSVYEISGHKFYYTNSDVGEKRTGIGYEGLIGYDGFPGTCDLAYLKKMELRGTELGDGFRVKAEFRDVPYANDGRLLTDEEIRDLGLDKYY